MENDGESGDLLFDFVEDVKTDFGIGTGLEFVSTMTGSDCDSEGVNTCLSEECFDFFGFGEGVVFCNDIIFDTGENSEFAFDCNIILMSQFNNAFGFFNVAFPGFAGTVDHDRGETEFDAALACFEGITVVEVQADGNRFSAADFSRVSNCTLSHVAEQSLVGILTCALGNLKNHRGFCFGTSCDDCLKLFHVVEVESGDSIAASHCFLEHFSCVDKTEILVVNHR